MRHSGVVVRPDAAPAENYRLDLLSDVDFCRGAGLNCGPCDQLQIRRSEICNANDLSRHTAKDISGIGFVTVWRVSKCIQEQGGL